MALKNILFLAVLWEGIKFLDEFYEENHLPKEQLNLTKYYVFRFIQEVSSMRKYTKCCHT